MTDPVADFLTRLRNAAKAQHQDVLIPSSKLKRELARILVEQGYIDSWAVMPAPDGGAGQLIQIRLKYTEDRRSAISGLRRVSRPGQRTYVDAKHIPKVLGGMGAQQSLPGSSYWKRPMPIGMTFPQKRNGRKNPLWPLRVAWCRILCAACVMEDNHSLGPGSEAINERVIWIG